MEARRAYVWKCMYTLLPVVAETGIAMLRFFIALLLLFSVRMRYTYACTYLRIHGYASRSAPLPATPMPLAAVQAQTMHLGAQLAYRLVLARRLAPRRVIQRAGIVHEHAPVARQRVYLGTRLA